MPVPEMELAMRRPQKQAYRSFTVPAVPVEPSSKKSAGTLLWVTGSPVSGSNPRSIDQFPDLDDRRLQIVVHYPPVT